MIPRHLIAGTSRRPHGIPGAIETVWVRHVSGGVSQLGLKSYIQGRESYEGTSKHVVWNDEEPPGDIYTEGLFRTLTTKGIVYTTFTPLQGMSEVVSQFLEADATAATAKIVIQAGWDDVPHLDGQERALLIASTPPYQREARTKGTPTLGAGAIYGVPEDDIVVADFAIPKHWKRCFGGDAGGGAKPTAAVWLAKDPETQIVYLYSVYKRESPEPAVHIEAMKARGAWIPGVMDAAALIVTRDDAEQLIAVYRRGGLSITLPDKAVESGIQAVWELMSAGLFKVCRSCEPWLKEFRKYRRDMKGRVVKVDDHLMDATRYAVYSGLALAKTEADTIAAPRSRYVPSMPQSGSSTGYMAG
jgi:phage terminase large subunit-like protein